MVDITPMSFSLFSGIWGLYVDVKSLIKMALQPMPYPVDWCGGGDNPVKGPTLQLSDIMKTNRRTIRSYEKRIWFLKFGIFFELSTPRPLTRQNEWQVYHNGLEQCRLADELGFDHV
jgi:hypothetical protein